MTEQEPNTKELARAEAVESAGMQNVVAAAGPGALLMIPVAWALTAIRRAARILIRQR